MLTTISTQFRWEMGHRLPFHNGLCKNLHGHSYEAHVILTGETDDNGMVMDYFDVSALVKPIIDELDHCFLVDTHDELMLEFFANNPLKVVKIEEPTTAENIAKHLLGKLIRKTSEYQNLKSIRIRVYETEKTYAEVEAELTH